MREIHNERCIHISTRNATGPEWDKGHRTLYFGSGRESLVSLANSMKLGRESVILVPAMVPEGIIVPFSVFEFNVQFYPVDLDLNPKWEQLAELLDKWRPRIAVLIHYFGLEKPICRFVEECHKRGAMVVEDLAHCLHHKACELGRVGDVVLYSFPKLFGVPDGAALMLNTEELNANSFEFDFDTKHIRYLLQQCILLSGNTVSLHLLAKRGYMLRSVLSRFFASYPTLMEYYSHPNRMSAISRWLLSRIDIEGQAEIRTSHARLYHESLNREVFCRFLDSRNGIRPSIGFPVRVKSRSRFAEYLHNRGIHGIYFFDRWDFYPKNGTSEFAEAKEVLEQNFLFPTAPHLSSLEVSRVIEVANAWALENS